jgi:segregation and condensation protein B
MSSRFEQLRLLEAILFSSSEPLGQAQLARHLPEGADLPGLIEELTGLYANRGVNLVQVGSCWAFRTASDLAPLMKLESKAPRKLTRVALETLAIIAYHQPVTRAEVEEIRGVAMSRGTLDILLEVGWVKPKGRRRTPGRPVTWGTTEGFLDHFGLSSLEALPGIEELKAAGLLDSRPAATALGSRGRLASADEDLEDTEEEEISEEGVSEEDIAAEDSAAISAFGASISGEKSDADPFEGDTTDIVSGDTAPKSCSSSSLPQLEVPRNGPPDVADDEESAEPATVDFAKQSQKLLLISCHIRRLRPLVPAPGRR